jgi:hypothetical protein
MGQLLACGSVGNNLAQEWHFSTEMFKHFLAAAQQTSRRGPANAPLTLLQYPTDRLLACHTRKGFKMKAAIKLACAVLLGTSANAQSQNCAPRDVVIDRLASQYGETRQSIGLGANNAMVEVFASPTSGTWTITVTSAHGITCLVASGQAFETLAYTGPNMGNDA